MSNDTSDHNLKAIRDQLLGSFTPETFRRLFRYTENPALRPVLYEFSPDDGLTTMIDKAIDYCENLGLLDALLREAQPALVPEPDSIESKLAQAQQLIEKRSYDEAIRILRRLYRIYPHNGRIEQLLLEALYAKGAHSYVADYNLSEARRAFEEVLSIDPFYEDANRLVSEVEHSYRAAREEAKATPVVPALYGRRAPYCAMLAVVLSGTLAGAAAGMAVSLLLPPGVPDWTIVISIVLGGILGGLAGGLLSLLRK